MKILLISGAVVLGLIGMILIVGWLLPVRHTVSRSARFNRPPQRVWDVITDLSSFPQWRTGLKSVDKSGTGGKVRWKETGNNGEMTFEVVESRAPERWVTRIAGEGLPFGGSWTYVITPADGASLLTVTEDGEVYNVLFRFMSRFVFGHTATLDRYLADLARRLGEELS
jgi:uncharacterized protein YndB with AHSA1/START domain